MSEKTKADKPARLTRWRVGVPEKRPVVVAEASEELARAWYAERFGVPMEAVTCEPA